MEKSDCSQHKKEIAGISDMKVLAEMIGDLSYPELEMFIGYLGLKLYLDGLKDRHNGRNRLGYALTDASEKLTEAALFIKEAARISKPFMTKPINDGKE